MMHDLRESGPHTCARQPESCRMWPGCSRRPSSIEYDSRQGVRATPPLVQRASPGSLGDKLARSRTRYDLLTYSLMLVATAAILCRVWELAPWHLLAAYSLHVPVLLALVAWALRCPASYVRWRSPVQAAIRLETFLMPLHRPWELDRATHVPPVWSASWRGMQPLDALATAVSLLGLSYAPVLALTAFAHAVPLWLHIPLQLVALAAMVGPSQAACAAVLRDEAARRVVRHMHDWLELPLALVPVPFWRWFPTSELDACRFVMTWLQVVLGVVLPTLGLACIECRALQQHKQEQGQCEGLEGLLRREHHSAGDTASGLDLRALPDQHLVGQPSGAMGAPQSDAEEPASRQSRELLSTERLHVALLEALQPLVESGASCARFSALLVAVAWLCIWCAFG